MQAGLLTEPIEIHRKVKAKSDYGSVQTSYALRTATKA